MRQISTPSLRKIKRLLINLLSENDAQQQVCNRSELDVQSIYVFAFGLLLASSLYIILRPFNGTYFHALIYERGFTQPFTILLASIVFAFLVLKVLKLRREDTTLQKVNRWLEMPGIDLKDPDISHRLNGLASLSSSRYLRVLNAYFSSNSLKVAEDVALDDSNFYLNQLSISYALPRILVWAIPLLGFIGTVVGISRAVNGFSGFLQDANEIEQLKEGIGNVTQGLSVAFDTTLLALLLSVLVMIPLVLVERSEQRFILETDAYINDTLLPQLRKRKCRSRVDNEHEETDLGDLESLSIHSGEITQQLERAAMALRDQVIHLESYAEKTAEIFQVQNSLHKDLAPSLENEQLRDTLTEIRDNIAQLKPVLEGLNRPRRITLVENKEEA